MSIFDSHAHYDDDAFDADRESLLADLPKRVVSGVVNAGASLAGSRASVALAKAYPYFYAAVGLHPEFASDWTEASKSEIAALTKQPKVVAIGEIGLDYHYEEAPSREVQRRAFEEQLMLAEQLSLPVIVHDRDAHGDTMEILRKHRPKGVLHCFSGSPETAQEVLALGMYLGLGGAVTFKNAKKAKAVAEMVPLDRLLLETDAPYMAPVPLRGNRCDSSMIRYVAKEIAQRREISVETLLRCCEENAKRLFRISDMQK